MTRDYRAARKLVWVRNLLVLLGPVVCRVFVSVGCPTAVAQAQNACGADGYSVVTRSWDVVLRRGWESRRECAHPERPLKMVATYSEEVGPGRTATLTDLTKSKISISMSELQPVMVKAGETVRLWLQDSTVRIEMAGVVERSAHKGEPVMVQITRQSDEAGLMIQRIAGTVSGSGEVEMER
jgi:Chaperone for flagella basal body P-ring formation